MIKIGSRGSKLALWQANLVRNSLINRGIESQIIVIKTSGDKIKDKPLYEFGGKGLFVKEIEEALIARDIDMAVHSMKDIPAAIAEGTKISAYLKRESPFDAFVSRRYTSIDDLPSGAVVGTSSLRRSAQLLLYRSDLKVKNLRGNIFTRLKKLDNGMYDGIIIAAAALIRLNLSDRITEIISIDKMIPASTQGIIGIQTRTDDITQGGAAFMNNMESETAAVEERLFVNSFGGGCHLPLAAYLAFTDGKLGKFYAFVSDISGINYIKETYNFKNSDVSGIGLEAYLRFKAKGAGKLLQ